MNIEYKLYEQEENNIILNLTIKGDMDENEEIKSFVAKYFVPNLKDRGITLADVMTNLKEYCYVRQILQEWGDLKLMSCFPSQLSCGEVNIINMRFVKNYGQNKVENDSNIIGNFKFNGIDSDKFNLVYDSIKSQRLTGKEKKMEIETFNNIINEQIERSKDVLIQKSGEYASDTDRLHNFYVSSKIQGIKPRQALAGMMCKHTTSIYDMVWSDENYSMDKWNEKITDHINYLLLLRVIVEEEKSFINR